MECHGGASCKWRRVQSMLLRNCLHKLQDEPNRTNGTTRYGHIRRQEQNTRPSSILNWIPLGFLRTSRDECWEHGGASSGKGRSDWWMTICHLPHLSPLIVQDPANLVHTSRTSHWCGRSGCATTWRRAAKAYRVR